MDAQLPRGQSPRAESSDGRADLHVHSLSSDGGQAPEALVRAAAGRLEVVAITDHDEIAGAGRALRFLRVWRQRRLVAGTAPTVSLGQGGHRGHS